MPNEPERAAVLRNAKNRKVFEMKLLGLCEQEIQDVSESCQCGMSLLNGFFRKLKCQIFI